MGTIEITDTLWARPANVVEFYSLWLLAALTYGAADLFTTIHILYATSSVFEANVLINVLVAAIGLPGLVLLKIVVILISLVVSASSIQSDGDPIVFYGPPILLVFVGAIASLSNATLLGW